MDLPEINDIITTERALGLCRRFDLDYLVSRIEANPDHFKEWAFDGCSCLPDRHLGRFTGCNWRDITYRCCLPHDLRYAYGRPGDHAERKRADEAFFNDLVTKAHMKTWMAAVFLAGVRLGGREEFGLSFSWAFARKEKSGFSGTDSSAKGKNT
jgi:hypothetical protein